MANNNVDRQALIKEALDHGFKEEVLQRAPTYAIMSMLQGRTKKDDRKHKKKSGGEEDGISHHVKQVTEQLQKEIKADDVDDTATVVDMSFVTSTENPADQKYKRFTFLVCAKNDLVEAIKVNGNLLQSNLDRLDEDDIMTMKKEIAATQYQLNLVNTEIREIHQWFQEVHAQKQQFYEQFLKKSNDISGNLTSHFQRKTDNIKKYIASMQEQAQLQVGDVRN
jgi:hypothetical protein